MDLTYGSELIKENSCAWAPSCYMKSGGLTSHPWAVLLTHIYPWFSPANVFVRLWRASCVACFSAFWWRRVWCADVTVSRGISGPPSLFKQRHQLLHVHLAGSVGALGGARCWVDRNHLSCVCFLSSLYQCESSEDLRSSAGTPALWHTPSLCLGLKEGKFDGNSTVGEIHSLGVHQSRAGCEVRGPDSLVVETRELVLTPPTLSHYSACWFQQFEGFIDSNSQPVCCHRSVFLHIHKQFYILNPLGLHHAFPPPSTFSSHLLSFFENSFQFPG